jgi:hypothetical protein
MCYSFVAALGRFAGVAAVGDEVGDFQFCCDLAADDCDSLWGSPMNSLATHVAEHLLDKVTDGLIVATAFLLRLTLSIKKNDLTVST